ncbi:MAG: hypothetical protein EP343_10115 [Deltaproteobacteria bacterium]|nr:MAG: hypothetical protein EP343_10115 [Deltaproteobacteria bacterium]
MKVLTGVSCLWMMFGFLLSSNPVMAQSAKKYEAYKKPFFSYLGIEGRGLRRISDSQLEVLEKTLRGSIEKGRFIFVKLPFKSVAEGRYVQKMVKLVEAKAMGYARLRSTWDNEFQGYAVTSEMLESIQNNSFYYWIEMTRIRRYYDRSSRSRTYLMAARVHIRQVVIFNCTEAMRKKGRRYRRACRMKRDNEYTGFARPFKIVKASVKGTGVGGSMLNVFTSVVGVGRVTKRSQQFKGTAENLGKALFVKLAKIKQFSLHAPISRATFTSVYTNIGKSEGVTVNQGFKVYVQRTNGKLRYKGYARIRTVGDNRMTFKDGQKVRVNPKADFLTRGQILSVSNGTTLQKGMLMFEHPMRGVSLGASVGLASYTLSIPGGAGMGIPFPIIDGTVLGFSLRLNSEFDLSAATTIPEFYLNVTLDIGITGPADSAFPFIVLPILPAVGILKKWFFRNIGLTLGVRGILGYLYANDASFFMVGGEGLVGMDIFIVPEFTVTIRAGFRGAIGLGSSFMSVGPWFTVGGNYSF